MSILADTNILLRRTQPDHPSHTLAVESVARLLAAGELVYFTLQNISEFWNVATRPAPNNGLGFSVALVLGEIEKIERFLTLLPDSLAVPQDSDVQYRGLHALRHRGDSSVVVVILNGAGGASWVAPTRQPAFHRHR
jgi:predicted nucleic acid-binding protein